MLVLKEKAVTSYLGLRTSLVAQIVKNLPAMWETQVLSLGQEDPLEWLPTLVFLPGEFHGQRTLAGHGVTKNWTQLSDFHFHLTSQLIYNVLPISAIQQSDSVL